LWTTSLDRLATNEEAVEDFLNKVFERWQDENITSEFSEDDLRESFMDVCDWLPITEPYSGTRSQRASLREFTSNFIGRYIRGTKLAEDRSGGSFLVRDKKDQMQISMLKELTWQFVIKSSALAGQQYGQEKVIRSLFEVFLEAVESRDRRRWARLPERSREDMVLLHAKYGGGVPDAERIRVVTDAIAGMTDQQAMFIYQRFTGITPGSAFDSIVV
jgi:dGTPase